MEDRGHFYDPVGALRDVVVNHLMQVVAAAAMEPPAVRDPRPSRTRMFAVFASMPDADPKHYVRGQYEGYREIDGVADGLHDRDLRGAAPRDRQLALVRGAVLHPHRQASADHPDRAAARVPAAPRGWASCSEDSATRARPARGQARPQHRRQAARRRPARRRRRARADQPGHGVRRGGRRGPTPYEVLLHAAMSGDSARFTRQDSVEETWRIMQPLLDSRRRSTRTRRDRGVRRPPTSSSPARRLARSLGRVMSAASEAAASCADGRRRQADARRRAPERRGALALPADRRLRLPLQLPHGRAGRARRRDRLALRAELRFAEHLRHPARPRGRAFPARAVRDQRPRRRASTSRARTCS